MKSPQRPILLRHPALWTLFALGVIFSTAWVVFASDLSVAEAQQDFVKAAQAYDEGRVHDAIAAYTRLVEAGFSTPELFYNIGNAFYRSGDLGRAVLNYRRAWHLAPRDPDIRANLRFALQSAGAVEPAFPAWQDFLFKLSRPEWAGIALAAYWLGAAVFALFLLTPWRDPLRRILVALIVLLALSLAGIAAWTSLTRRPEIVVLAPNPKALFAPIANSNPHFAIPAGALARTLETADGWTRIAYDNKDGWLPQSACAPIP